MKIATLFVFLWAALSAWNGLHAQQQAGYTFDEQTQLDSIKQTYLRMGIPEAWAERRAQTILENRRSVQTRSSGYAVTPFPGSIWLDRDSITGALYASHAHDFTPEEFVKDVFVKGGRDVADQAIRNVTLISSTWQGSMTNTWNDKGYMGPFGGDAGTWTSSDHELLYFDHGDVTTMIPGWDGNPVPAFGMRSGFLLATGPALVAEGTNSYSGTLGGGFQDWATIGGGTIPPYLEEEPNLSPIAYPNNVFTLTSLEFDFCSFTDSVTFQYIFASEEFSEYSNSPYNDAFGFFISGPGLTDAWGNSGDTINIARYPNGMLVAVNNSNWGRYSTTTPLGDAVSPEYHIPMDLSPSITEYDGHSIVLTAKAKLQKGVWYHMKLAIGNVSDNGLGSGVFLQAGSLDLGAPESDIPRPYVGTPYDSIYGWNSFYANCDNSMLLKFDPIGPTGGEIKVWTQGDGAAFTYDPTLNKTFSDTITYHLQPNDSTLTVRFKVSEDVTNASQVQFFSNIPPSIQYDSTEVFDLYAKSKTELIKYIRPTASYTGILEVRTTNGSPYLQRSINGGLSWEFARDTVTGEPIPFSIAQIALLAAEEDAYIIFREPNTCCSNDTLFISRSVIPPVIERVVTLPVIPGAIVDKEPGRHTLESRRDFTFTITPTGNNASLQLTISTSRTSVPDSEGVIIEKNEDGSYTVTIREVQEPVEVYVDFVTSAGTVENNRIWTSGNQVYLQTDVPAQVQVYAISGAFVQSRTMPAGETAVVSLPKGFFLIVINGQTHKVIVK